jgi:hypothetical protein
LTKQSKHPLPATMPRDRQMLEERNMRLQELMDEVSRVAAELRVEAAATDDERVKGGLRMAHAIALSLIDEMERAQGASGSPCSVRRASGINRDAA